MLRRTLPLTALLLALSGAASATSFIATTDAIGRALVGTSNATSDVTGSFRDDKIVLAARDDAATYVGSAGAIQGARLQAAFEHIRALRPQLGASDQQLAEAILTL